MSLSMTNELITKCENAKKAARILSNLPTGVKNAALLAMADGLIGSSAYIIEQNKIDIKDAEQKNTSSAMLDRLLLNEKRIESMADGIRQITALPDPIGKYDGTVKAPNGLLIGKVRVPLGVIGIIYEARPNVTADAASLCIKTGNAVVLRGGSDALRSNMAIVKAMCREAEKAGLPHGAISLIEDTSRETAVEFMKLNSYIDVLIPRGGVGLIKTVVNNATVPVIETGAGNCHVYVEKTADPAMALKIVLNAKISRPSVCNAAETLLIDRDAAKTLLPQILSALAKEKVEIRGCHETREIFPDAVPATPEDWETEYNDYIIAVKVVDGIDEAIEHITKYGTKHSEAIITSDYNKSQQFLAEVDAAAVYVNASTRFTDGFEFGFGAEIGISTQKMHARGPMGLNELTSIKYAIYGNGQIR